MSRFASVCVLVAALTLGTSAAQAEILTSRARILMSGTHALVPDETLSLSGLAILDSADSADPIFFGYMAVDWVPKDWLILEGAVGYLIDTQEVWLAPQVGFDWGWGEAWVDTEVSHAGSLYYSGHARWKQIGWLTAGLSFEGWWLQKPAETQSHGGGIQIGFKLFDLVMAPSIHLRWNDGVLGADFLLKVELRFGPHPIKDERL